MRKTLKKFTLSPKNADNNLFNEIAHANLLNFQVILKSQLDIADGRVGISSGPVPGEFVG